MKEATGELNMTIVVIIAVAAILGFLVWFLPNVVFPGIQDQWNNTNNQQIPTSYIEQVKVI